MGDSAAARRRPFVKLARFGVKPTQVPSQIISVQTSSSGVTVIPSVHSEDSVQKSAGRIKLEESGPPSVSTHVPSPQRSSTHTLAMAIDGWVRTPPTLCLREAAPNLPRRYTNWGDSELVPRSAQLRMRSNRASSEAQSYAISFFAVSATLRIGRRPLYICSS